MSGNSQQAIQEGGGERIVRDLRNLHLGIGAAALLGAVVFPQVEIFSLVAGLEGISVVAHEGLRQVIHSRRNRKLQPA